MKWIGLGVSTLAACSSTYPSVISPPPPGGEPYHAEWAAQPEDTVGSALLTVLTRLQADDWVATVSNAVLEFKSDHQRCLFRLHAIRELENGAVPTVSADHQVFWCQLRPQRKSTLKYICRFYGQGGPHCSHQTVEYMQSQLHCNEPGEMSALGTTEVVVQPLGCGDSPGDMHVFRAIAYEQDFR